MRKTVDLEKLAILISYIGTREESF